MKIDIIKLVYDQVKEIELKGSFLINESYWEDTEIIDLKEVTIFGKIKKNAMDEVEISLEAKGIMVLEDARTLNPVNYEYSVNIEENIEEKLKNSQNILDIEPILWENIVLEVPIRIISGDSPQNTKGNGWELKDN